MPSGVRTSLQGGKSWYLPVQNRGSDFLNYLITIKSCKETERRAGYMHAGRVSAWWEWQDGITIDCMLVLRERMLLTPWWCHTVCAKIELPTYFQLLGSFAEMSCFSQPLKTLKKSLSSFSYVLSGNSKLNMKHHNMLACPALLPVSFYFLFIFHVSSCIV